METIKSAKSTIKLYPEKNDNNVQDFFLKNIGMKAMKHELEVTDVENILKHVIQRILDYKKIQELDQIKRLTLISQEKEVPKAFICSITEEIMKDPVITPAGHSYERDAITAWLAKDASCPITRQELHIEQLIPNRALKQAIETFLSDPSKSD